MHVPTRIDVDQHLSLQQLQTEDAERLFELVDNNRAHLLKFLPWPEQTKTPNDSLEFIQRTLIRRDGQSEYAYGMMLDTQLVGHISLMHLYEKGRPEIGYWIAKNSGGKGVTKRATVALTRLALEELGLDLVIIRAEPHNIPSNKIAENCGYTRAGSEEQDEKTLNVWVKHRRM